MTESNQTMGLLEYLSFQAGCMYLSDLRLAETFPLIGHALQCVQVSKYDLREWTDAVWYITGEKQMFQTSEEAFCYLLEYLQMNLRGK